LLVIGKKYTYALLTPSITTLSPVTKQSKVYEEPLLSLRLTDDPVLNELRQLTVEAPVMVHFLSRVKSSVAVSSGADVGAESALSGRRRRVVSVAAGFILSKGLVCAGLCGGRAM
jgi:hypothetical protein